MADDLDNLLRAAMKTLDDEVPSGYFEALPNQTLARLEGSMQHGSSGTTESLEARDNVAPPVAPVAAPPRQVMPVEVHDREEDSGLHDIRNLAQSTKQRLSSRRITSQPMSDEDILASSSGSFKNIALPQPARMVSLPEIADLPTTKEVEKAGKKARESAKKIESEPAAAAATELPAMAPVVAETRQAFTLPSQQRRSSKGPLIALVGTGLAAAAGVVIFMQVNKSEDTAAVATAPSQAADLQQAETTPTAGAAAPAAEPAPPPAPVEAPKVEEAPVEAAAAQIATNDDAEADEAKADDSKDRAKNAKKPAKSGKGKLDVKEDKAPPVEKKAPDKTTDKTTEKGGEKKAEGEGEPSFDALLKEAGVEAKKDAKPKLEKKSLTGDDFKKGMSAVSGKAKGCYKGTVGTAMVKLTVAPSGQVTKAAVTGEFAGKSEGACVESAVKAATFPPWDGGPQSFTYSYMLSD